MQINYQQELNPDQLAAVTSRERHALVLAGAGSGKTRTLTYRVAWLLEQGVFPWQILLLTFTNKAASEMLTRVEDITGIPRSEFYGGTFHSIGQRILRGNAELVGRKSDYTILDANDADTLFSKTCKQVNAEFLNGKAAPKPGVIYDLISYSRNTRRPLAEIIEERMSWVPGAEKWIPQYLEAYSRTKQEQNLCDYDDLLELFLELLEKHQAVRERYQKRFRHILVDEFQDTNTLQSAIIANLSSAENSVMAVGDDAQCIYTWRGANYENITRFPEVYPDSAIHKIEINYRSTPQILNFANSILSAREESLGFSKTLRSTREGGQKPFLVATMDAFDQARVVIKRIRALIENEGRSPEEIVVLYRAHSHAKELQLELTREHIPFLITSGLQFFQQAHIRDFVAQLRFLHNKKDSVAFTRILTLMEKVGPATATKTIKNAEKIAEKKAIHTFSALLDDTIVSKIPEPARDDYTDFVITLQNMHEALHGNALETKPENVPAETGKYEDDLFSLETNKTKSVPVASKPSTETVSATPAQIVRIALEGWYGDFIKKIYSNWQERQEDLKSLIEFAEKFQTIDELLSQLALMNSETTKKDVDSSERNTPAIRLSTVHQAKGLEFPIVFVIGCADEMFPLKRAIEEGDVDEERRLFYVACTRAKDELYMLYQKIRSGYGGDVSLLNTSRFIREADPATYEVLRVSGGWNRGNAFSQKRERTNEYSQEIPESEDDPF